jgi:hypothetical protein
MFRFGVFGLFAFGDGFAFVALKPPRSTWVFFSVSDVTLSRAEAASASVAAFR